MKSGGCVKNDTDLPRFVWIGYKEVWQIPNQAFWLVDG
jgi:hypothetical protein